VGQGRVHVNAWAKGFLMGKLIDISGQHFGLLTIVCREGNQQGYSGTIWRCRCECGKEVVVYKGNLTSGKSLSCGCLGNTRKKNTGCVNPRHTRLGAELSREQQIQRMKSGITMEEEELQRVESGESLLRHSGMRWEKHGKRA